VEIDNHKKNHQDSGKTVPLFHHIRYENQGLKRYKGAWKSLLTLLAGYPILDFPKIWHSSSGSQL
jgi:hypothetical protein